MISVSIVEDNDGLRRSLTSVLEDAPGGVKCAGSFSTAEEALREIPKNPPEVVLMDIHLPGMSGIECPPAAGNPARHPGGHDHRHRDNDKIFDALRAGRRAIC